MPALDPELSTQERTVLRHLSDGLSTKDIAAQLGITVATVRNHVQHILHKFAVHSRTEAVVHAIRDHLV
jgi:two-component system nitrate/nitrite response regulator NarL